MDLAGIYRILFSAWGSAASKLPAGLAPPPLQLFFEISDRCNLKCGFCFYRHDIGSRGGGEVLRPREVERAIHEIPSARLVAFAGAEPFCRADFMEMLEAAARRRIASVETNGTMISGDLARRLVRMAFNPSRMTGLASIDASLHGPAAVHDRITGAKGSFGKIEAALRALHAARSEAGRRFPLIHVKTVICGENAAALSETRRLAAEMGADAFLLKLRDPFPMSFRVANGAPIVRRPPAGKRGPRRGLGQPAPEGRGTRGAPAFPAAALAQELKKIRAAKKGPPLITLPLNLDDEAVLAHYSDGGDGLDRYSCSSPWTRVSVMPYGDVFFCKLFGHGNVRQEGLAKSWNSEPARAFRRRLSSGPLPPECKGCCFLTRQ
ncbi:MAG: radical SAM protein [Deltaproteobacteria bacterium]|nr:radical SAM protein [Deltaproteobacteria bacterium]